MIGTYLGSYNTSVSRTHVRFQFSTHAATGGNVAPLTAFEAADLRIYKATDGAAFSATQRSSSAGITMTSPFDSLVGFHDVDIDLTDNTDASFYVSGFYSVVLAPDSETIDSQTITGVVLAYFEIGVPAVNAIQISGDATAADNLENAYDDTAGSVKWNGIIDQGTAQTVTSSTLQLRSAAAFADDCLNGATAILTSGTQIGLRGLITDYVGSTDTATVTWSGAVTPSGTPTYQIWGSAEGASLTDIGTAVWATGTRVLTAATNLTTALATPTNITAGTITTVTNLTNAPTAGDLTATMKTSVGTAVAASAVASVTGNVGGNVTGSVGSVVGAVGSVTAAVATTSNIKKNQALASFEFLMTDSTNHAPATSKTVTCTRSLDGAAFGAGTLTGTAEVANGIYKVSFVGR